MAAVWVWFGTIYLTRRWRCMSGLRRLVDHEYDNEQLIFEAGDHQTLAVHGTKSPTSAVALEDGRYWLPSPSKTA